MKHLNTFGILLVCMFLVTSCSKDEDDGPDGGGGPIVGTWEMTALDYTGNNRVEFMGQVIDIDFDGTGRDINTTVDFNSDGSYSSNGSYVIDYAYDIGGMEVKQPVTIQDFAGSGTYTLDGNQITVTDDATNETQTHTVNINGDDMEMIFMQRTVQNNAGAINTIVVNGDYQFERK